MHTTEQVCDCFGYKHSCLKLLLSYLLSVFLIDKAEVKVRISFIVVKL